MRACAEPEDEGDEGFSPPLEVVVETLASDAPSEPARDTAEQAAPRSPPPVSPSGPSNLSKRASLDPRPSGYRALAPATIAKHGGRYLVRGGASEVIEGGPPAKMIVVMEFPSMTQAKGWYDFADYAEARAISKNALSRRLLFIEGIQPQTSG